ncbi:MAG: hypothetical protein ABMA25_05575 [Ilumatobacteraceae bacterium]
MLASNAPFGPGAGDVMGQATMQPGGVATMERNMPVGEGELPPAPAAPPRPPRRTLVELLGDFVKALPIILFAVVFGGGSMMGVDALLGPAKLGSVRASRGDTTLPRFSAPVPTFGTATFHVVGPDGYDARVTTNFNATQVWYEFLPFSNEAPGGALLANPAVLFARENSTSGWRLTQKSGAGELHDSVSFLVVGFDQIVPLPLREYTSVRSSQATVLSGHQVTRYELRFDIAGMNEDQPAEYATWLSRLGPVGDADFMDFTVWVDAQGIIWKGALGTSETSLLWTLEYMGPEQFVVQFPTTYFNEQTGQQVNG